MKRNKIFNNTFLLLLTIITFFIGIFFHNSSDGHSFIIRLEVFLLGFLPFAISLLLMVICSKKKIEFNNIFEKSLIVKFGLVSSVFFYYLIAGILCIIIEITNPITDIKSYKKIVYDELLTFFPKDIPQNAINAQLYYSPAFLQAGEQLHLYYIDESMTNELFMRKYQNKAILSSNESSPNEEVLRKISSPLLENCDNINEFLIYLEKNKCNNSEQCYHNEIVLVAFNEKTKELLYIYEFW